MSRKWMPQPRRPSPRVVYVRRRPRRPRRRFHWFLLAVPLVILSAVWLGQGIQPAATWEEVMDALNVRSRERYTQLATLGVLITAGLAVSRVVRK